MIEQPSTERGASSGGPSVALGAALVIVGIILFASQAAGIALGDVGWPLWIIVGGGAILFVGLLVLTEAPVVVGGTVVTTVGLVLLYQDTTGHWESWAYAWALVGPAATGLGTMLWGIRTADGGAVRNGTWGLLVGLALFVIGFLFFEGVIGISGRRLPLPEWTLPAAIIVAGLAILVRGLFGREASEAS